MLFYGGWGGLYLAGKARGVVVVVVMDGVGDGDGDGEGW